MNKVRKVATLLHQTTGANAFRTFLGLRHDYHSMILSTTDKSPQGVRLAARLAQHYFCRWPSFLDLGWSWEEASGRTKPLRIVFTCQAAMKQSNKRHAKSEQIQSHHCCGVIAYFVPKSGMPIISYNYMQWRLKSLATTFHGVSILGHFGK